MIGIKWFFVNGILLAAATNMTISGTDGKAGSVKSTFETSPGFNNTDNAENIYFLNKVQRVIKKMKNVFENNRNARRNLNSVRLEEFTDFIQDMIKKLNRYDDTDLENFFAVFNNEVTNYHYRGCKFHELTENFAFRIFLSGLLNEIKIQPGSVIKTKLKAIADKMKKKEYNRNEKELIDVINLMYRQDSLEKFQSFLLNIDAYRLKSRKNLDLVKIVKEGLRSVIFDHYTHLNHNARRALKLQINDYWNNLSRQLPLKAFNSVKISKNNDVVTENTNNRVNKRIIVKEKDRYIELGLKYDRARVRNSVKRVTSKSLYLPNILATSRSNKTSNMSSKSNKYSTKKTVQYDGKFVYKKNRKLNKNVEQATRTTKHSKTARHIHIAENMNLKYETDAYEYLTTDARKIMLAFQTLYPEFVTGRMWTKSKPLGGRRKMSQTPVDNIRYVWQESDINDITLKPRRRKDIRLVKNIGVPFQGGMENSPVLRVNTRFQKFKRGAATKKFQVQLNNPRYSIAKETSSEKLIRLKNKFRLSKPSRTSIRRRYFLSTDIPYKQLESFSLEDVREQRVSYRRNDINNTTTANSTLTITNESFQVQQPVNIREGIGTEIKNDDKDKILKSLNNEAQVTADNDQMGAENKNNKTALNYKVNDKHNNTKILKDMPKKLRIEKQTGKYYPNDLNENKTYTISDDLQSENKEGYDSYTNRPTNNLETKQYVQDNVEENVFHKNARNESEVTNNNTIIYAHNEILPKSGGEKVGKGTADSRAQALDATGSKRSDNYDDSHKISTDYNKDISFELNRPTIGNMYPKKAVDFHYGNENNLDTAQVNSEQRTESDGELEEWKPQARKEVKDSSEENENYFDEHKQSLRKQNDEIDTSKIRNENITDTENNATAEPSNNTTAGVTKSINLHTAAIVDSKTTHEEIPVMYYADNFAKIDSLKTKPTTVHKSMTKRNIEDIGEQLQKEVANSGDVNIGQDMYRNTAEQIDEINENDIAADMFPEFVPVLDKTESSKVLMITIASGARKAAIVQPTVASQQPHKVFTNMTPFANTERPETIVKNTTLNSKLLDRYRNKMFGNIIEKAIKEADIVIKNTTVHSKLIERYKNKMAGNNFEKASEDAAVGRQKKELYQKTTVDKNELIFDETMFPELELVL